MTGGGRDGEGRGGQGKEGNVGDEPGEKERGVLRAKKTDPPPDNKCLPCSPKESASHSVIPFLGLNGEATNSDLFLDFLN